jgi:mannosyltransferase
VGKTGILRNRSSLVTIVLLVGITLLALGLRLYHLNAQSLWYDEGFSVYLAHMSPGEIVSQTAADIQPPLYYLMLHGWMQLFGDDEPAVRGLSVLFGVLTVPLIYGVAWQLSRSGRRLVGLLAALLLAVSPLHVWYGQETRMYTLLTFLCLLSSYFLLLLASRSQRERDRGAWGDLFLWLAYTLTSIAAVYTHYFALFILAFQAIYVLIVWWRQDFRPARLALSGLASGVAITLAYLPWLPHLLTRYGADTSYWPGQLNLGQVVVDIALSFVGGETLPEQPGTTLVVIYALVALLALFMLATRSVEQKSGNENPKSGIPFLLLYLLLPPVLILILSYNTPKFNARYVMISQPALLLLLAGGLEVLWHRAGLAGRRGKGSVARVAYGLLAALPLVFLLGASVYADRNAYGDPSFARADFRAAIRYLRNHIQKHEAVILTSGHLFPVYDYYAQGLDRHLLPDSPTLDTTRTLDFGIAAELNRWLADPADPKEGVWLMLWQDEVVDPVGYLTTLLDGAGEEQPLEKTFPGVRLKHYRFPQGTRFPEGDRPAIAHPADFNFDNKLHLLGYDQTGENQVTLFWEALQPLKEDYRVSLSLRDTTGQVWGRWDGRPTSYLYPTDRWRVGQIVFGRYDLPQVPGRPPGDYGLEVGIYTENDLSGLDVLDPAGLPQSKRAVLGAVRLFGYIVTADQITVSHPARSEMGDGLVLLGWDLDLDQAQPGDRLQLDLGWEVVSQPRGNDGLRLLVTDSTGQTYDAGAFPPTNAWHPTGVWQQGQAWRGQIDFRVPIQAQPGEAQLAAQLVDASGAPLGAALTLTPIRILPTDRVFTAPQPQVPRPANLDYKVTLLGADLPPGPLSPGSTLRVTLYWRAEQQMDVPYTVFVHLLEPAGKLLVEDNSEPAGGARPTTGWVPGEYVTDPHELLLPLDLPAGIYLVEVGMYDAGARGLPRLAIIGSESQGTTDRVIFGPIKVQ